MLTYPEYAIEHLIAQGTPLELVEEHINSLPLDRDTRSALWLLAWVRATSPAARRDVTDEKLAHLH